MNSRFEVEIHKYRHDCTHFNWNLGIQMIVVYQFLNALSWCIFYSDLVLSSSVTTVGRPKDSSPWMFVCSPSKILCSIFELTPLYSSWLTDCKWRWFRLFLNLIRLNKSVMISQNSRQDGKLSHKKILYRPMQ